jgi:hypothetical protein
MEQFNKIIEFRQAIYDHGLTLTRDAQFELVDALLLSPGIRSFPELSLSPAFRRKWPSCVGRKRTSVRKMWLTIWFCGRITALRS